MKPISIKPVDVEIMGDDGQWQPLEGVTAIELHMEPAAAEEAADAFNGFMSSYLNAMQTAAQAAAQGLATMIEAFKDRPAPRPGPDANDEAWRRHDAADSLRYMWDGIAEAQRPRVIDQDGNPVRPCADRPAWQSPYGPPKRRNRP